MPVIKLSDNFSNEKSLLDMVDENFIITKENAIKNPIQDNLLGLNPKDGNEENYNFMMGR
jgi:hypothetical protein